MFPEGQPRQPILNIVLLLLVRLWQKVTDSYLSLGFPPDIVESRCLGRSSCPRSGPYRTSIGVFRYLGTSGKMVGLVLLFALF